jgi:hypothetical protein
LIWVHESSYFWRGLGEMGVGRWNLCGECEPVRRSLLRFGGKSGCAKFRCSETTRSHGMAFLCLVPFISFATWKGAAFGRSMLVLFMGRSDHPHGMFFRTSRGLV